MRLFLSLFLVPTIAVAITVNDRGTGGNNTSEASTVCSPSSTLAAGSEGLLAVSADNANLTATNFPTTSITDSAGNVWVPRSDFPGTGSAGNNLELVLYTSHLTANLTSGGNVTITYTGANVTAKAYTFTEIVPGTSGNLIIPRAGSNSSISTTGTPTVNSVSVLVNDVVFGWGGAESADTYTGDSDTTNGSWSTQQHAGFGSGTTGMSITSQWKIQTTATSTQTYNPTLTSADQRIATWVFTEVPPRTRVAAGNGGTEAATTVTFLEPIASGSPVVMCWGGDNSGTNGNTANLPTTLTDSRSNTWTLRQDSMYDPGLAKAGAEVGVYTATLTTAIQRGDTVVITYVSANVPSKNWIVYEFANSTGYANSGVGTGATTGTPSVTTGSITAPNYVIGFCGAEATEDWVADSDTTNGTWSSIVKCEGGLAGGQFTLTSQYKATTASGTQTYNPTCTSNDTMIGWAEMTVPATAANNKYVHFLDIFP